MVKQGSIIKVSFDPIVGSEQSGYRPAVVISNNFLISKTNIISICPITKGQGKTALNVLLDNRTKTQGAVLCAHSRSIDIKKRPYTFLEQLPADILNEVINTVISTIEKSE
jgi:mRNA interferase MazF